MAAERETVVKLSVKAGDRSGEKVMTDLARETNKAVKEQEKLTAARDEYNKKAKAGMAGPSASGGAGSGAAGGGAGGEGGAGGGGIPSWAKGMAMIAVSARAAQTGLDILTTATDRSLSTQDKVRRSFESLPLGIGTAIGAINKLAENLNGTTAKLQEAQESLARFSSFASEQKLLSQQTNLGATANWQRTLEMQTLSGRADVNFQMGMGWRGDPDALLGQYGLRGGPQNMEQRMGVMGAQRERDLANQRRESLAKEEAALNKAMADMIPGVGTAQRGANAWANRLEKAALPGSGVKESDRKLLAGESLHAAQEYDLKLAQTMDVLVRQQKAIEDRKRTALDLSQKEYQLEQQRTQLMRDQLGSLDRQIGMQKEVADAAKQSLDTHMEKIRSGKEQYGSMDAMNRVGLVSAAERAQKEGWGALSEEERNRLLQNSITAGWAKTQATSYAATQGPGPGLGRLLDITGTGKEADRLEKRAAEEEADFAPLESAAAAQAKAIDVKMLMDEDKLADAIARRMKEVLGDEAAIIKKIDAVVRQQLIAAGFMKKAGEVLGAK